MKSNEEIRKQIRSDYAGIADNSGNCCAGACGVTETIDATELAQKIGYSPEELEALPADANMGLSCGNPTVIAALKEGETLLDLGSGGGFDVFLAGPKVGKTGQAIGIDMTPQMIDKARANIEHYQSNTGLQNVEFRLGEIEHLPVADSSVDVIISNCVLNLSLDKQQVWNEIARVLKPGGRVAISDIALLCEVPDEVKSILEAWAGCVAGAIPVEQMRQQMVNAGMDNISLIPKAHYVNALTTANDPLYAKVTALLPEGQTAEQVITSLDILATKPYGCDSSCC